jgi:NAD(P)-dependent dehydrogenase (short-subunit alcohol dehydrogenase family)
MIIDLTGKRAIVTGATSGIGFAIACGLAESGAAVVLNGRTQKNLDVAMNRLAQHAPQVKVEGVAVDLAAASRPAGKELSACVKPSQTSAVGRITPATGAPSNRPSRRPAVANPMGHGHQIGPDCDKRQ